MKRLICFLIILSLLLLSACGEPAPATTDAAPEGFSHIDMDLSAMNDAMVYPTVLEMFGRMESYDGQVVKMSGKFSTSLKDESVMDDDAPEEYYYECVVQDVTACCLSGLEFILAGDPPYPEGYPPEGSQITIVGRFTVYEEGEYIFPHLLDTQLLECTPPEA